MRQQLADATSEWVGKRHSLTLRQTPRWAQSFVLILVLFGGAALAASFVIRIDEVVTVKGRLRPLSGTREVLAPVSATLASVEVKEGITVLKGQILARYDTRDARLRERSLVEQIDLTRRTLKEKLALSRSEEQATQRSLSFSKDVARRYSTLVREGASSDLSYLSQLKQVEDLQTQLIQVVQKRAETELEVAQRLRSLESDLAQTRLLLSNSIIRAPIAGTVFELTRSATQVTGMGEPILKIVPAEAAKAEVFVSNQDIGFVRAGQPAKVRVDAYPYTKFGDLTGKVSRVGADVLEPDAKDQSYRFPVEISLNSPILRSNGIILPLKPGMSVQANLRLREKPVISLLSDMFVKNFDGLKTLRQ